MSNEGLATFKQKWGSEAQLLYRAFYPTCREVELNLLESTGRLQKAVWRRLPIKVTVVLGDWLHRYF